MAPTPPLIRNVRPENAWVRRQEVLQNAGCHFSCELSNCILLSYRLDEFKLFGHRDLVEQMKTANIRGVKSCLEFNVSQESSAKNFSLISSPKIANSSRAGNISVPSGGWACTQSTSLHNNDLWGCISESLAKDILSMAIVKMSPQKHAKWYKSRREKV